ncbi:phytosulfokines 1-like [Phragmites australis]|uniref:phytosulfokines 1-like n=1 Tax=Phragmites australis TaxID=29695 RepID=UPI002D798DED|nr:phytosulfokines 1-like [Phragmites australis]
MHARRTAMALVCLLCLPLLLVQGVVHSRKLLWTVQEKQSHGGLGSHGTGTTTNPEPCSGRGGSTGSANQDQVQCDTSKWAEIHTDYIYTQDVKHP